jgi:hypothetical protein
MSQPHAEDIQAEGIWEHITTCMALPPPAHLTHISTSAPAPAPVFTTVRMALTCRRFTEDVWRRQLPAVYPPPTGPCSVNFTATRSGG